MRRVTSLVYPAVTFVVILAAWQAYVSFADVPSYLLPSPAEVARSAWYTLGHETIWHNAAFTMKSMLLGYLAGCGFGIVLGALVAESKIFDRFVYPYVVLLQCMPKVALAPLIIVWFGFGIESKIVMVLLLCFFPVFLNTMMGIRQTDPELVNVLRACGASRARIFFRIKLPSAAGSIFAGLQIAVSLGLIGAIVAEFVASRAGLGVLIQKSGLDLNTPLLLTTVFLLAAIGLLGNLIVGFLYKKIVFWEEAARTTADSVVR
jgi:NitT/TauT family transport system permease protein